MMALGMPVIVSPLPSYTDVINNGSNGYIASSPEEWKRALCEVESEEVRERIGRQAREDVIDKFSIENIARQYLDVIAMDR